MKTWGKLYFNTIWGKTEFRNTNKSQVESGNFHIILPAPACRYVVIGENQNCEKIIGKDMTAKNS